MKKNKNIIISIIVIVLILVIGSVVIMKVFNKKDDEQIKYESGSDVTNNENFTGEAATVYMTTDISSEALVKIYEKLEWNPSGKIAVKMSTGEPPASNYLRPELIGDLVKKVNGTIVECNTAYGGSRSSTASHKQVARDHGFYDIADVDILDEEGSMSIPVQNGELLKEDFVGTHFPNYDYYLVLSHFKGHAMAGFGGAIKNISIGLGSSLKCF